jgi:hypothetical protein
MMKAGDSVYTGDKFGQRGAEGGALGGHVATRVDVGAPLPEPPPFPHPPPLAQAITLGGCCMQ